MCANIRYYNNNNNNNIKNEEKSETTRHVISACPNLAQKEHKKRHDKVTLHVHWELYKKTWNGTLTSGMNISHL